MLFPNRLPMNRGPSPTVNFLAVYVAQMLAELRGVFWKYRPTSAWVFELRIRASISEYAPSTRSLRVIAPDADNSTPCDTWRPERTCGGSVGSRPGVRALSFATRNRAPANSSRFPATSHLAPASVV